MKKMRTPIEVADALGIPLATLYQWRTNNKGPRGYRVGKHLRYMDDDVDDWLAGRADPPLDAA